MERWHAGRGTRHKEQSSAPCWPTSTSIRWMRRLPNAVAERSAMRTTLVILCSTHEEADAASRRRPNVGYRKRSCAPPKTNVGTAGSAVRVRVPRIPFRRRPASRATEEPNKFSDSIREKTRRSRGDSLVCVVASLNPLLRGWFDYYKHAHHTTFTADGFVRRRLRGVLRKRKRGRDGASAAPTITAGPTAFFADVGLFTLHTARLAANNPDEETTDWRAVCGSARTVRREGAAKAIPTPIVAVDHRQPLIGEIDPMAEVTASVRFGHGKINRRRTKTRAETQPRSRLPVARVAQPSMLGEDDLAQPAQLFGVRRFVAGARQANSDHGHFSGLPCAPASRWRREAG